MGQYPESRVQGERWKNVIWTLFKGHHMCAYKCLYKSSNTYREYAPTKHITKPPQQRDVTVFKSLT